MLPTLSTDAMPLGPVHGQGEMASREQPGLHGAAIGGLSLKQPVARGPLRVVYVIKSPVSANDGNRYRG